MKFGYAIVYVPDVRKAMDFYEAAFGLRARFLHDSGQYGEMDTGGTALAFADETFVSTSHSFRPNRNGEPAAGFEIALVAPDVPAAFTRACSSGATAVLEPETKPWGQVVSYVRDLNGVLVEICSAITSAT
jgi:lactoylglutathione lyase